MAWADGKQSAKRKNRNGRSQQRYCGNRKPQFERLETRHLLAAVGLDPTFDGDGVVTTEFRHATDNSSGATSLVITSSGKILSAGSDSSSNVAIPQRGAIIQYNADGSLDQSFGDKGIVTFAGGPIRSIALQTDGKFVVVGGNGATEYVLARFNTDGTLDTSFDGDGIRTGTGYMLDVAIQGDGKIVIVGRISAQFGVFRFNVDGTADTSFDGDGQVVTFVDESSEARTVAIQSDGKLLVGGTSRNGSVSDFALARYNVDGTLDAAFSDDGIAYVDMGSTSEGINEMALHASGKIVAVGGGGSSAIRVAQFNTDGTLDASFDADGKVLITGSLVSARSVAIQSDGKIVIVGQSEIPMFEDDEITVWRLNGNGSLDNSFDGDGRKTTGFGNSRSDSASGVAIQSDGKIVVVGYTEVSSFTFRYNFALVRYNSNGSEDLAIETEFRDVSRDEARGVAVQSDGKVLVVGFAGDTAGSDDFALARYNTDGSLDTTFGTGGKVTLHIDSGSEHGYDVLVQSDGKIVIVGGDRHFYAARFNSDGSLDTSFDGDGKVTIDFGSTSGARRAVLQADGKIVMAGFRNNGAKDFFAVARLYVDGTPDTSFDGDGRLTTAFGAGSEDAYDLALQSDGKIVVAGRSNNGTNFDFALTRYNVNGSLDVSFDGDGRVLTDFGAFDQIHSVQIQADGKILVAGKTGANGPLSSQFALARYNSNGSLDTTFDGDGRVTTNFAGDTDVIYSHQLQADGKILVVGGSIYNLSFNVAIGRYNSDGSLDLTFDDDGKVITEIAGTPSTAHDVVLLSASEFMIVGWAQNSATNTRDFLVARYSSVTVTNPTFTSPDTAAVAENATAIMTVTATHEVQPPAALSFTIAGGADAAKFQISLQGSLSFVAAPDFELPTDGGGDNVYEVTVQVDDGAGGTATQSIEVTILPVNDNDPEFTSSDLVSIAENTTAVTTVLATDEDLPAQAVTYSIVGGGDRTKFTLSSNGALSFIVAPDFELPTDSNGDNLYVVIVQASDGTRTSLQAVLVTVTNAPETLLGDYNLDGRVDAADYTKWRDLLGTVVAPYSSADGDGSGVVDAGDHAVWVANFGQSLPAAGGGAASRAQSLELTIEDESLVESEAPLVALPSAWFAPAVSARETADADLVDDPIGLSVRHDQALIAWLTSIGATQGDDTDWDREPTTPVDGLTSDGDAAELLELAFATL